MKLNEDFSSNCDWCVDNKYTFGEDIRQNKK